MAQLRPMPSVIAGDQARLHAVLWEETIVMRLLLLLIVLVIIGLTLSRQLSRPPATLQPPPEATALTVAPAVPTRPQDLKPFEQDINRFMQDAAAQRRGQADPP